MPVERIHWLPLAALLVLTPLPAWANDDTPDTELLEFLASWMDDEGDFVDPVQFEKMPLPEQENTPSPGDADEDTHKDGKNGEARG